MYIFFHDNNLFYKYQAGFLPGHSTVYQLIETYYNILKSIDDGKSCCMIFHSLKHVQAGVPQGSVLVPLLF
jgi:hypothetical protein